MTVSTFFFLFFIFLFFCINILINVDFVVAKPDSWWESFKNGWWDYFFGGTQALPPNAISNDINNCLFKYWTAAGGNAHPALSGNVECTSLNPSHYWPLCYGLNTLAPSQFASCYDDTNLTPVFTGNIVKPVSGSGRAPGFIADTGPYKPTPQAAVDDYNSGRQETDFPGFDVKKQYFCSKGHFTPNSDFGPIDERSLTFITTNIAPQWQKFNGGNWATLENDVRAYVTAKNRQVYVFTGVGGAAKNLAGVPYKMNGRVQAPQYYWKLICDPVIKQMVVYVGKNSVGSKSITKHSGCRGRMLTEELGVMQCGSQQNIKSNPAYSDFKMPTMHNTNCPSAVRGTFLDTYTNNFK
ncbi:hypothetical protein QZH41_017832 [Actinostola sp. cb2023]|nr:hypothetical protein QZH41_017832 [Actinostola sp. cb2023]